MKPESDETNYTLEGKVSIRIEYNSEGDTKLDALRRLRDRIDDMIFDEQFNNRSSLPEV